LFWKTGKNYTNNEIQKIRELLYRLGEIDYKQIKESKKSVKTAVIYTRVSTEEKAVKGNSLVDQEELLRKACEHHGNCRTTGLNEAVALIDLFQKELGNKKAEHSAIPDKTFGDVPRTGSLQAMNRPSGRFVYTAPAEFL